MGDNGSVRSSARQRGSKVLHGFANALLERGLPRIRSWLRERLGADADLANLRLDGPRVHLEGVHLPLGGRAHLQVDEATVLLLSKGVTSPRLRLHALRGAVCVNAEGSHFRAPVTLIDEGDDDDDAWVRGTIEVSGASWTSSHGVGEQAPLDGRVAVRVTLRRWALSDGHFTSGDSALWLSADGAMDNNAEQRALRNARLVFREARAGHLIDALQALTGMTAPDELPLPWASLLTGQLSWDDEGRFKLSTSVRGDQPLTERAKLPEELRINATVDQGEQGYAGEITLESAGTSITLSPLSYRDGSLDGSQLTGKLALNEAVALGLFPTAIHPTGRGAIVFDLTIGGSATDPQLHGRVTAETIELIAPERPGAPPLPLHEVTAELDASRERLRLTDLRMSALGARLDAAMALSFTDEPPPPMMTLSFVDAPAELVAATARLAGGPEMVALERDGKRPDAELWIPRDAQVSGTLKLSAELALVGQLAMEATTSALMLELRLSPEQRLDGSQLKGRLSAADALRIGLFSGPVRPIEGTASIEAELQGVLPNARLTGRAHARPLRLDVQLMGVSCDELSLRFSLDQESLAWSRLEAKMWDGLIESDGVLGFGSPTGALDTSIQIQRLAVAEIPLARSGDHVGEHLAGAASGRLRLERKAGAPLSGVGDLIIREPHYRFMRLTGSKLRDVGLPPPPERGTGPLTANLDIDPDGLRISELEADVEGCRLDAQCLVAFDGSLEGEARLRLAEAYLRQSALLIVPAAFTGSVSVPISLAGSLRSPTFDADIVAVLSSAFRLGRVGSAMSDAMGGVRSAMDGVADKVDGLIGSLSDAFGSSDASAPADEELERLVDRIMAEDPDTDRLIDRLIDAGVTSEDIVKILEQRRMRFGS